MFSRVNWGSITASAVIGIGISFCFASAFRAIEMTTVTNPPPIGSIIPVLEPWRAVAAVIAMGISFSIAGAACVLFGRFQLRSQALLHSLASFLVATIAMHYLFRGALFIGFPGYPLGTIVNLNEAVPPGRMLLSSNLVSWTVIFSLIAGSMASIFSGLRAFRWLESNKIWGEKNRAENLRKAS